MNAYFATGRLSDDEKNDILKQHRTLYDGYRVLQNKTQNEQPLYVQDFAKDKIGAVMNNKGSVKPYTNVNIHEQVDEVCDECGVRDMSEEVCECGGMMKEGECMECGYKMEEMDENWGAIARAVAPAAISYISSKMSESEEEVCECGGMMKEGECMECGYKMEEIGEQPLPVDHTRIEETGHLDDIYKVADLGDNEFDYVEGGGNKYGTFKFKKSMKEQKYKEIDEVGFTGGGNIAADMEMRPAYDFISNGPGDVYPTESEMDEEFDFEAGESDDFTKMVKKWKMGKSKVYDKMESAWSNDEMNEANDVSGVQGIYGDMKPAYDFDSEGPGSAGPYQRSSWGGLSTDDSQEEDEMNWEEDFNSMESNLDNESWEDIKKYNDWVEIDEDLQESFVSQKNKIMEMMNRINSVK